MKSKKRLLSKSRLYVILDKNISAGHSLYRMAQKLNNSGTDIIQLRDKNSDKGCILESALLLRKLFLNSDMLFILNDYLDIAKIADCDGVHLGQDDGSVELAREILGEEKIIGLSCHNLKQALLAQKKGADYIGIGPIFPTSTKPQYRPIGPDIIKQVKKKIKIPFFPIGGIDRNNIGRILSLGAKRVAICRAIIKTGNIAVSAEYFSETLKYRDGSDKT